MPLERPDTVVEWFVVDVVVPVVLNVFAIEPKAVLAVVSYLHCAFSVVETASVPLVVPAESMPEEEPLSVTVGAVVSLVYVRSMLSSCTSCVPSEWRYARQRNEPLPTGSVEMLVLMSLAVFDSLYPALVVVQPELYQYHVVPPSLET